MGFENLYGVEINEHAAKIAQKNIPNAMIMNSSIEDFQTSKKFDIVFTAGVLIHINPKILDKVIKKMINLSSSYIFGFEYFAETLEEIQYRGNSNTCWKQNFLQLFFETETNCKLIKKEFFNYKDLKNTKDIAYLLEIN